MSPLFLDRRDAGRRLAGALAHLAGRGDVLVLALPRGGVAVGYEVARALGAPLDVLPVRKLGLPARPEVAMGAVAPGGVRVLSLQVLSAAHLETEDVESVTSRERAEVARRERAYRGGAPPPDVRGRTVVLVDDGLATGATMTAAVAAVRHGRPERIVAALPVGAPGALQSIVRWADEVVCLAASEPFGAVAQWYVYFAPADDDEVRAFLGRAAERAEPAVA